MPRFISGLAHLLCFPDGMGPLQEEMHFHERGMYATRSMPQQTYQEKNSHAPLRDADGIHNLPLAI